MSNRNTSAAEYGSLALYCNGLTGFVYKLEAENDSPRAVFLDKTSV
ncbi:MAG: hypothetical protein LBB22_06760 [Treponema sp.]|nr:hypothetical protein [Treponema sp.]